MLQALPKKQKSRWRDHLSMVVHAYNCTRKDSTGFSPFYLVFDKKPRLPIDIMFDLKPPQAYYTYPEYVKVWRGAMREAYQLASAHSKKSAELSAAQNDKKVRHAALCEGDRVLVRNLTERGVPGKLYPYWEQQIYIVTQKRNDMPVYEVKPENADGRSRVLPSNLLLSCTYLPVETQVKTTKSTKTSQRGPRRVSKQQHSDGETPGSTDEDMSGLTPRQLEEL